ncbi:MAG: glycoside hydrolase family 3 C-terminal domain-containing protein [Acidobacteriaceae bacterium]
MTTKNLYRLFFVLLIPILLLAQSRTISNVEVEKRVDQILSQMTLDEKIELIGGTRDFYTRPIPRLHIPSLRMSDGPLGVHDYGPTTAYPAPIAVAASWDTDLAKRVGESMGNDARARGVNFILAPGMDMHRAPMCGRNFEYLGEDPYLASRMAVSLIEGIQDRGVIATAKHFVANDQEFDRNNVSSDVDERTLREIYLPPFEASVKEAHVGAIMDGYNPVNGVQMTQNGYLNNQVVKKEWGFDGIIMSDWGATHDGVAAANGGLDLEMPTADFMNRKNLLPAIQSGAVSQATIDDKVRRILRKAIQFGFFDRDQTETSIPLLDQQSRAVALEAARSGMVLLKNAGNLLPLDPNKIKTIAVIGPNVYPAVIGGGGSSQTKPFNEVSALEGISNYLGTRVRVLYGVPDPPLDKIFSEQHFVTAPGGPAGITGEYFKNMDLSGTPVLTRVDPKMQFRSENGNFAPDRVEQFSAKWQGYFVPKNDGYYTFYTSSDDGVRLYIDEKRVIDDWNPHSETVDSYATHLEGGKPYKIKVEYFDAGGGGSLGVGVVPSEETVTENLLALAKSADAVILGVGFDPTTEGEGFDRTFALPGAQDILIQKLSAVNKNTIVVVNAGGNVDMRAWLDQVPALLYAWYPGQEGGTALAQILFGEYSPSGKLPVSFERRLEDNATFNSYYPKPGTKRVAYTEGIFLGYRHFDRSSVKPLFPFGSGLSYTKFQYSDLKIEREAHSVRVSFSIKNVGDRQGAEVAQVYVGKPQSRVPRAVKELKGFVKLNLKPGEQQAGSVVLDRRSFAYYDTTAKDWEVEPGQYQIFIGSSSEKMELVGTVTLAEDATKSLLDSFDRHPPYPDTSPAVTAVTVGSSSSE